VKEKDELAQRRTSSSSLLGYTLFMIVTTALPSSGQATFHLEEATVTDIHAAYKSGRLTSHELVRLYLDRIYEFDKKGPALNSIITINPRALEEADRLDAVFKKSGFVGPLHGVPVILKDMIDAQGMPTTEGSIVLKNFVPDKDAFIVDRLKKAGAIILAKATLSEFATGDTYGSLFGATKNPYDFMRTPGGSSGGTGASIAANFASVGIGEEGLGRLYRAANAVPSSSRGLSLRSSFLRTQEPITTDSQRLKQQRNEHLLRSSSSRSIGPCFRRDDSDSWFVRGVVVKLPLT